MGFFETLMTFIKGLDIVGINEAGVVARFALAVLCGGLIGIEREHKHRPAGFRTHTLVCIGAAMTTMTGQYLQTLRDISPDNFVADPARLGAQVIAGIGFIGAGTIIVTRRRQVKGLTTAAGLWTAAIVGLCCGAGFFEGAVFATIIIILAELVFARLEYFIVSNAKCFNLFVEYSEGAVLANIVDTIKKSGAYVADMEITKSTSVEKHLCATFSMKLPRQLSHASMMTLVAKIEGVVAVEEL